MIRRFFARLSMRRAAGSERRRRRALGWAEAEMKNRRIDDGTIWRSGKGGSHHG